VINASIVALALGVPDDNRDYRISGFNLGMGHRNTISNSTAVGTGGTAGSAGFGWPEDAGQNIPGNGVWTFNQGNLSHNNHDDGLFSWQNTGTLHDVTNFVSYHNGEYGIEHGAYVNSYRYANAALFGNGKAGINTKAKPRDVRPLSFENILVDGGGISPAGLVSFDHVASDDLRPILFFHCEFKGQTGAAVSLLLGEHQAPEIMDFVDSNFSGTAFQMRNLLSGTRIRVQNGTSAFQLDAGPARRPLGTAAATTFVDHVHDGHHGAALAVHDHHLDDAAAADHRAHGHHGAARRAGQPRGHRLPGRGEHGRGGGAGHREYGQPVGDPPHRLLRRRRAGAGGLPVAVRLRLAGLGAARRVPHPVGDPAADRRHHHPLGHGNRHDNRTINAMGPAWSFHAGPI
jgi:hypothetical protein